MCLRGGNGGGGGPNPGWGRKLQYRPPAQLLLLPAGRSLGEFPGQPSWTLLLQQPGCERPGGHRRRDKSVRGS